MCQANIMNTSVVVKRLIGLKIYTIYIGVIYSLKFGHERGVCAYQRMCVDNVEYGISVQ